MYDYQDLACVYCYLLLTNDETKVQSIVPEGGGEDCMISLADGRTIEIQVKGQKSEPVTLEHIADWLSHFPSRQSNNSLLERITTDSLNHAVFICAERCADNASCLIPTTNIFTKRIPQASFTTELVGFLEKQHQATNTNLKNQRNTNWAEFLSALDEPALSESVPRIIVLERKEGELLRDECRRLLNSRFAIPQGKCNECVDTLCTTLKNRKGDGANLHEDFGSLINRFSQRRLKPEEYVSRVDLEESLLRDLKTNGSLFIKGNPMAGKTYLARALADALQAENYHVQLGSDIDDAESFLEDPVSEERAFLLDDPLGDIEKKPDSPSIHRKMVAMTGALRPGRLLIVPQREDILNEAVSTSSLNWLELSTPPSAFLCQVWSMAATQFDVPAQLKAVVEEHLADESISLEIGAVVHLASHHSELPEDPTREDLLAIANQTALEIMDALRERCPEALAVTVALAAGAQHSERMNFETLKWVLDDLDQTLIAKKPSLEASLSLGEDCFPETEPTGTLTSQYKRAFDLLRNRKHIEISESGIEFRHPYFRQGGLLLIERSTGYERLRLLKLLEKCLFSYDPETSKSTAMTLGQLLRHNHQSDLVGLLVSGLDCLYTDTKEICSQHLTIIFDDLAKEEQKQLLESIRTDADIWDLKWHRGAPRVPITSGAVNLIDCFFARPPADQELAEQQLLQTQNLENELPSAEALSNVIRYVENSREHISEPLLSRLMLCSSAPIRSAVIKLWFQTDLDKSALIERMRGESHPRVVVKFLKCAVNAWNIFLENEKAKAESILKDRAEAPVIATAMLPFLVVFDRVEHAGESPPWPLWAELVARVLEIIPVEESVHTPRLFNVFREALPKLRADDMANCCNAWVSWLLRRIEVCLPDDFSLGVGDILITSTKDKPHLRQELSPRLLEIRDTGSRLAVLSDYIANWDLLVEDERSQVISIVNSTGADSIWIHALVITRPSPPPVLIKIIFGEINLLEESPDVIVDQMPPELLAACVRICIGEPYPLWTIGVKGGRATVWPSVTAEILKHPHHPLFPEAFEDLLFYDDDQAISQVVSQHVSIIPEQLFDILLNKVVHSTSILPKAWDALLAGCPGIEMREQWITRMAEASPAVVDSPYELRKWIINDSIFESVLKLLPGDYNCIVLIMGARKTAEPIDDTEKALMDVLDKNSPQIFGTYDYIKQYFQKNGARFNELISPCDDLRSKSFDLRKQIADEKFIRPEKTIPNWYFQSENRWTDPESKES